MSSFSAGFFGAANRDITERKQYIRARVDEDRSYLREQGLKRQAGIASNVVLMRRLLVVLSVLVQMNVLYLVP